MDIETEKLPKKIFYQHLINYTICKKCGHLNGLHEDTLKFTKWLYEDRKGKNYSSGYTNNFDKRVKNIYLPKANFLKSIIKSKIKLMK